MRQGLVLISTEFHREQHSFVHGDGDGASWFRHIVSQIYPRAARILGGVNGRPANSPSVSDIRIAEEHSDALPYLIELRQRESAGNAVATQRILDRQRAGASSIRDSLVLRQSFTKRRTPQSGKKTDEQLDWVSPVSVVKGLRKRGYLARQNKKQSSLYLNLGGPQSEIDRVGFCGVVLLFPAHDMIFGIDVEEIVAFRNLVMTSISGGWVRKNSRGPAAMNRFALELRKYHAENTLFSDAREDLRIETFSKCVKCVDGRYSLNEIEEFLSEFSAFSEAEGPAVIDT